MDDVYSDIGYTKGKPMDFYVQRKNNHENSIRVEFINGINRGKVQWIRWDLAERLIKTGIARDVYAQQTATSMQPSWGE